MRFWLRYCCLWWRRSLLATSRSWQSDPIFLQDQGWPPLRGVARNTLALVVIQVALGAAFRYGSIGVMVHILGALVVVVFILTLVVLVTLMPEHPTLRPAAITLGVVTFVQIFLGLTVVSMGTAQANKGVAAVVAVAHVATGAVTLATTLVVALESLAERASGGAGVGGGQGSRAEFVVRQQAQVEVIAYLAPNRNVIPATAVRG